MMNLGVFKTYQYLWREECFIKESLMDKPNVFLVINVEVMSIVVMIKNVKFVKNLNSFGMENVLRNVKKAHIKH